VASGTLWQGSGRVPLRARTAAVLRHLLERRGDVVSRDELRRVVWGKRHGSEHGPKQCVRELRSLFCDAPAAPRYIETVGQSGYRLIGDIELMAGAGHERDGWAPAPFAAGIALCVGREPELEVMDAGLAGARRGERQVLFIAGEPGIGKTTLIDAFAGRFDGRGDLWVVRGQCVPHDGPGEAYGPLLTAAEQLATGPVRTLFVDLVRRVAPRLLTQMPAVFDRREMLEKEVEAAGGGPEQALREFIHVFEQLSRHLPGILVIEDAHWADASTCNWISAWALRRAPANLLLVVSYRPGGTADRGHAARQMLAEVRRAPGFRTLELSGLTTDALARYLDIRFPENAFSADVASVLQERTEGHALFVAGMIEDWLARGILSRRAGGWGLTNLAAELAATLPTNLQELIDRQLSQIADDERRLLELASAAGLEFSAAALAESADRVDAVERQCEFLVERQLLLRRPEPMRWPDGTDATGYGFRHALYRHAIYETIPANLRRRLHLRIGLRLEQGHGKRANEIAAVLSNHFALGGDDRRAALYGRKAAETALLRGAAREAQAWLRRALSHIARWRPGRARDAEEIRAQTSLGAAHNLVDGFASPPAAAAFERAYVLSRRVADSETLIPILTGLFNYRTMTNDTKAAKRLAARILRLAQGKCASAYAMDGYNTVGYMNWKLGDTPRRCPMSRRYRPPIACGATARCRSCSARILASPAATTRPSPASCGQTPPPPNGILRPEWRSPAPSSSPSRSPKCCGRIAWWRTNAAMPAARTMGARDPQHLRGGRHRLLAPARPRLCRLGGRRARRRRRPRADGSGAAGVARHRHVRKHALHARPLRRDLHEARPAGARGRGPGGSVGARAQDRRMLVRGGLHRLRGELALRSDSSGRSVNPATSICFRQAARVARRQGARLLELRALVSLADERAARGEHAEAVRILAPLRPFFERGTGLPAATAAQTIFARSREVLASASRVGQ
jgi:DNA-binding winged helix-turn-helix (wHTH) protein